MDEVGVASGSTTSTKKGWTAWCWAHDLARGTIPWNERKKVGRSGTMMEGCWMHRKQWQEAESLMLHSTEEWQVLT
jgi:hypothetical protein